MLSVGATVDLPVHMHKTSRLPDRCKQRFQAQDDMPGHAPARDGLTEYEVTVHTADIEGAGTDADVSLTMFGSSGSDIKRYECLAKCK